MRLPPSFRLLVDIPSVVVVADRIPMVRVIGAETLPALSTATALKVVVSVTPIGPV